MKPIFHLLFVAAMALSTTSLAQGRTQTRPRRQPGTETTPNGQQPADINRQPPTDNTGYPTDRNPTDIPRTDPPGTYPQTNPPDTLPQTNPPGTLPQTTQPGTVPPASQPSRP